MVTLNNSMVQDFPSAGGYYQNNTEIPPWYRTHITPLQIMTVCYHNLTN